ncbi:MAG: ornithine cyclodeaminase family protein [SAR202 cluster bacterium]|nr:ornithine cyclodeaminase family protein [SAR202 cluster bacterium]
MPLYLTESDVENLLTMDIAIDSLDEAFRLQARGLAFNHPRYRLPMGSGTFAFMAATAPGLGVMGTKTYGATRGGVRFYVNLVNTATSKLLAVIEASRLGQVRTGAASGVATRYMARPDAATVGMIGTGYQARTQLEAVCKVRHVEVARVYGRTEATREEFAASAAGDLGLTVIAARSAEECVKGADIVITVTSSSSPVLSGEWITHGTHINAAGSNHITRRELDPETIKRATVVVADDTETARVECGELIHAVERGILGWNQVLNLSSVVAGEALGRKSLQDITLFESQGLALEDIAVGLRVYKAALQRGIGKEIG